MVNDRLSPKTVEASSKPIPCFAKFVLALFASPFKGQWHCDEFLEVFAIWFNPARRKITSVPRLREIKEGRFALFADSLKYRSPELLQGASAVSVCCC